MLAFRYILTSLGSKLKESLISVLPVSVLVVALSLTPWVDIPLKELNVFVAGALMLILGIGLFNLGADMAMTPMGQYIGEGLTKSKRMGVLIGVAFVMGTLITIAEPDLAVLAEQVHSIMNGKVLIATVGVGVGLMLMLGVIKIIFHSDLTSLLLYGYMALFCLAAVLIDQGRGSLLSLSFDSGGVTTGPITVPFLMAIGVGIAMTIGGRGASENSFGLIALCSVGPILAVLALSMFSEGSLSFAIPDYSMDGILDLEGFDTSLAEGVLLLTPFTPYSEDEAVQNFVKAYEEKFNETPIQFAADAYDCVYAIYDAFGKTGLGTDASMEDICEAMIGVFTGDFTASGLTAEEMKWEATGEVNKTPKVCIIEDGKYVEK